MRYRVLNMDPVLATIRSRTSWIHKGNCYLVWEIQSSQHGPDKYLLLRCRMRGEPYAFVQLVHALKFLWTFQMVTPEDSQSTSSPTWTLGGGRECNYTDGPLIP